MHRNKRGARLLDHLVGEREQRPRYVDAQCPRGLEINDKLKLSRLLNRQVAWPFALKDAIDIGCRLPVRLEYFRPIGHQAAIRCEVAERIDCGQAIPRSKRNDRFTICCGEKVWQHEQGAREKSARSCARSLPRREPPQETALLRTTAQPFRPLSHTSAAPCLG